MRRFRHRRGYNIHSPFAFNLVTGVIYERGAYYAYDDLRNLRKTVPSKLRERDDRLLLRLINASMAKEALVIGDGLQMQTAYLRAGRPSCLFREITTSDLRTSKGNALKIHPVKVDFLYLDAPLELWPSAWKAVPVSYTHLDVYKRQSIDGKKNNLTTGKWSTTLLPR